jgi:predicted GTPase
MWFSNIIQKKGGFFIHVNDFFLNNSREIYDEINTALFDNPKFKIDVKMTTTTNCAPPLDMEIYPSNEEVEDFFQGLNLQKVVMDYSDMFKE